MRGALVLAASVDWTLIIVAVITAVPATLAAYTGLANRKSLKTPSGTSIGKQVEDAHHTALANNYRLQAIGDGFDVPMPDKAAEEEARVEAMNDVQTKAQRKERNGG